MAVCNIKNAARRKNAQKKHIKGLEKLIKELLVVIRPES
jgi:hypothetical protein